MIKIITLLSIVFLIIEGSFSQQVTPPKLDFVDLEENWFYISEDTNFIKSPGDKWSTPYWEHRPIDVLVYKNNLLILENCTAQSPYGVVDGSLLHCLDVTTGKPNWIFHNNSYIGLKHREDYLKSKIEIFNDTLVRITGYKALDTLDKTKAAFGFYCNPVTKLINLYTGKLISERNGADTIRSEHNAVGFGSTKITRNGQGKLLHLTFSTFVETIELRNIGFRVYTINDSLEIDANPIFVDTFSQTSLSGQRIEFRGRFEILNPDTVVLFLASIDKNAPNSNPLKSEMIWIDISDVSHIRVVKRQDMFESFIKPQDDIGDPIMEISNENIVLHQLMNTSKFSIDADWFSWIHWMDKHGNTIAKVGDIFNKNLNYTYVRVLQVRNGVLYMAVVQEDETNQGIDILKVLPGTSKAIKVGSITIPLNSKYKIGNFSTFNNLLDDNVLISATMDHEIPGNTYTNITYYFSFKLNDLGVISTSTNEILENRLILVPNPTSGFVSILNLESPVNVTLFNMSGKAVKSLVNISDNINISDLPSGMYILDIRNKEISERHKIVKVE